jgi:hypothetical protein
VWHGVTYEEVAGYSPTLASRVAGSTAQGIPSVVAAIIRAIGPSDALRELHLRSLDGRYQALQIGSRPDVHYQIFEIATGRIALTTRAQYRRPNNVKAGTFSPDSRQFAAAYHYNHLPKGRYTWIGIWDIGTGALLREREVLGWLTTEICREFTK